MTNDKKTNYFRVTGGQAAIATYNPATGEIGKWQVLDTPAGFHFTPAKSDRIGSFDFNLPTEFAFTLTATSEDYEQLHRLFSPPSYHWFLRPWSDWRVPNMRRCRRLGGNHE